MGRRFSNDTIASMNQTQNALDSTVTHVLSIAIKRFHMKHDSMIKIDKMTKRLMVFHNAMNNDRIVEYSTALESTYNKGYRAA